MTLSVRSLFVSAAMCAIAASSASTQTVVLPPDVVSTVFVTDTIPGYGAVGGVATDALGFVYIADFRNAVFRLAPDGTLTKFADGLYGASGNTTGPRGHLFQSSYYGNYISRISRDGVVETWVDTGLNGPVGIAAAPDGTLFVVNCIGGSVSRVAPDRTVSEFARDPRMACPNGITMDDRGDLYVVSFNSTKVLRVSPDGAVSEFADIPGAGGNGHIAFSLGGFYVTKNRANQVYRVARDGSVRLLAGSGTAGGMDGPALDATLSQPNGVAVSPTGDEVWVNELRSGQGLGLGVAVVALRRIRVVSLTDVLTAVDPSLGVPGVEAGYASYHDAHPGEETSTGAIALGYQWLTAGRIAEGVALFGLNAARFAADATAQFHFGEAFRYTGRPDRAAEQYRRALQLDPAHVNAAARLAEVSGEG